MSRERFLTHLVHPVTQALSPRAGSTGSLCPPGPVLCPVAPHHGLQVPSQPAPAAWQLPEGRPRSPFSLPASESPRHMYAGAAGTTPVPVLGPALSRQQAGGELAAQGAFPSFQSRESRGQRVACPKSSSRHSRLVPRRPHGRAGRGSSPGRRGCRRARLGVCRVGHS